jgi:hypothetical protein
VRTRRDAPAVPTCRDAPDVRYSYFQFLVLPSASHAIAVATRFSRVASVFASLIHSMYSRWCHDSRSSKAMGHEACRTEILVD